MQVVSYFGDGDSEGRDISRKHDDLALMGEKLNWDVKKASSRDSPTLRVAWLGEGSLTRGRKYIDLTERTETLGIMSK